MMSFPKSLTRYNICKKGVWNRRILDLQGAMGWTPLELAQHLGFRTPHPIYRVLHGSRPIVSFLLKLQKLESVYAGEIAEFIREGRQFALYQRRRKAKANAPTRPSDIAALGVVEAVDKNRGLGLRASKAGARRLDAQNVRRRNQRKANKKAKRRRYQDYFWRSAGTLEAASRRKRLDSVQKEQENARG